MMTGYAFSATLMALVIVERVLNAVAQLLVRLVWGTSKDDQGLKGYASTQLVGAGFTVAINMVSAFGYAASGLLSSLLSYATWFLVAFAIFSALFVIQEQYAALLIQAVESWNAVFGPVVYEAVFFPLQVLSTLFTSVVPIYNGLIWLGKLIMHNVLLRSAIENADSVLAIGRSIGNLAKHVAIQIPEYATAVAVPCAQPVADTCYDPGFGNRIFDFITPMADVRAIAASIISISISVCGNAAGIVDIVLYPFLDINLAKAVHNLFNSALYLLLQLPSVTVQRCNNNGRQLIMCLPDFEPVFNLAVAGTRNLGQLVDNWLDVSSIIVQKNFGLDPRAECEAQAQLLTPASYSRAVFGTNRTVVVGLTPGLYAVTDGTHAQYFNHYDSIESTIATNAWPIEIDVRFGVAAVTHSVRQRDGAFAQTTTTMMGCRCLDSNGKPPMRLECALALKEKIALQPSAENVFEVVFQQRSTANYMTCAMAQISIQSVRWPATRFVSTAASAAADYDAAANPAVVDATIWVSPLCTSRATRVPEVCTPIFKAAACYPYCMAARLHGTGANGLVLYNANEWRDRVHLMHRDCNKQQIGPNPLAAVREDRAQLLLVTDDSSSSSSATTTVESASENAPALNGASVLVKKWDPVQGGCVQASLTRSLVGKEIYQAVSKRNVFRSVLLPGQPFAYSGDVTLTAVRRNDGSYAVAVDRLYGSEANEYTMVNVMQDFPAHPPADTIKIGGNMQAQVDKLPIPYSFSDMAGVQHPAVSSRSSVFFAVNPSLAMFKGFASGCLPPRGMVWQTQLSALSSYAPIRVWKIDPFAYCAPGNDDCGLGRVHFADIPGAFTEVKVGEETVNVFDIRKCDIPFAVSVTGLEYINEENIAVTVLWAAFDEYDPFTGLLAKGATKAYYKVLFLSTETMGLSETPWSREYTTTEAAASEGMLCPAMRRLPNLGSLGTELAVAGIEIARKIVDIGISLPGLVEIWDKQQSCSLVTRGHSLLKRCGSDLLSLDNFFEALNRANAHFWRSFSLVAERIRDLDEENLANVVDGVAYYGESTVSPLDAYKSTVGTMRVPAQEMGDQFIQGVMPMADKAMANELAISANPLRMAQFSYDLVSSIVADIIPLAIRATHDSRDREAVREILAVFNNKIYQARDAYYGAITLGMMQAGFLYACFCMPHTFAASVKRNKQYNPVQRIVVDHDLHDCFPPIAFKSRPSYAK